MQQCQKMWIRTVTTTFADAIDRDLPSDIDYPYIWPNRLIPGQLRTPVDKAAADMRRWVPPAHDVPEFVKNVPNPA